MDDQLGSSPVWILEGEPSSQSAMGLRLWPVQPSLLNGCVHVRTGDHPLPDKALRTVDRPVKGMENSVGRPKARPVEIPDECDEVRKVCPTCSHSGVTQSKPDQPLSRVRGKPWGDHVGIPPKSRIRRKQVRHGYVMDLFSGKGGVSTQCERLGFFTKQWDIKHGPFT